MGLLVGGGALCEVVDAVAGVEVTRKEANCPGLVVRTGVGALTGFAGNLVISGVPWLGGGRSATGVEEVTGKRLYGPVCTDLLEGGRPRALPEVPGVEGQADDTVEAGRLRDLEDAGVVAVPGEDRKSVV